MSAPADVVDVGDRTLAAGSAPPPAVARSWVPLLAAGLVLAHVGARLWTAAGGWFARQDLLAAAEAAGLPFATPGAPGAAALARLAASVAPFSWATVVALVVAGQLVVDVLLYRLLVQLFGRRPAVLLLLTVFLTSSLGPAGGLWWSAAVAQLPAQVAVLLAVTAHVRHLRTHRPLPALAAALAVLAGTAFSLPVALLPLVLLAGTALRGPGTTSRARWAGAVRLRRAPLQVAAAAAGVLLHAAAAPGPLLELGRAPEAVRDLPGLLGRTVVPGLVGGPWSWDAAGGPFAVAAPPPALGAAAAAVVALVLVGTTLAFRGAAAVWLLGIGTGAAVLLVSALSPADPAVAGRLPLAAAPPALLALLAAVALGLATLPVPGAGVVPVRRTSSPRVPPRVRTALGAGVSALLVAGAAVSTAGQADRWHDNAARDYVAAASELVGRTDLVVADATVPAEVVPPELAPANTTSVALSGLPDLPLFLQVGQLSAQLVTLDAAGRPQLADVEPLASSGTGPRRDCGWLVGGIPAEIPLDRRLPDGRWIVQVSWFGSSPAAVRVDAGGVLGGALVDAGLGDLFLQVDGPVDDVTVVVDSSSPVCVGAVRAGTARPLQAGVD